jgi:hypothetical protein
MAGSNEAMIAIAYASRASSDRRNNGRETIEVREFYLCLAQRFKRQHQCRVAAFVRRADAIPAYKGVPAAHCETSSADD